MAELTPLNIVQGFKGINNRLDPTRLGMEYQLQADNVLCDDAGYLIRRPGVTPFLSGFKDGHGTRNGRLLAITEDDELVELLESGDSLLLHSGVTGGPFQWVELGYAFFLQSKSASWAVYPDRVIPWGSLCPSPPTGEYPLGDPISYPPPVGDVLCARRSQIVVGVWEPERDRSVLYFSRPDFPHEFRLIQDFILLPGQVTLLASVAKGLVMATDRAIFIDPVDAPIERVADYGVPLGGSAYDDRDFVIFWSQRGLCKALPFQNLTDQQLVVQQRESVTAGIFPYQGSTYAVVAQSGKVLDRQIAQAYEPLAVSTIHPQGI